MVSLICVWTNGWVNNRDAGDCRRHCTPYDVIVSIEAWPRRPTTVWPVLMIPAGFPPPPPPPQKKSGHGLNNWWLCRRHVVLVLRAAGPSLTTAIWRCRNPFSQWRRSFQRKLHSHWLKFLRQHHVAVVKQGPVQSQHVLQLPTDMFADMLPEQRVCNQRLSNPAEDSKVPPKSCEWVSKCDLNIFFIHKVNLGVSLAIWYLVFSHIHAGEWMSLCFF